jgi:phenylpyruvate tautomerase PptA (4-oxalocrotonate tautomerase family)
MPTYIVRAPETSLTAKVKQDLAEYITRAHARVTSAADAYVQVLFFGSKPDDCYLGGTLLRAPHCFIQGHIRAGRSAIERAELIRAFLPGVSELLGVPRYAIWIYISELPARAMAEFGHILPEQGEEDAWRAALPEEDRRRLDSLDGALGESASAADDKA